MPEPVRLLHITHDLAIGGLQQVIVNLCEATDRSRFALAVLCLRARGELADQVERLGIPVHLLPQKKRGTDYFTVPKITKVIRATGARVLHTHNTQPFIEGSVAGKIARVRNIVHTDHGRQWPDKRRYIAAEWLASHLVHRVVGVSGHTSQCLRRYVRIAPEKIVTIQNGVNAGRYNLVPERASKRVELSLPATGPIIGLGCRLVEGKGIGYLIQAVALLRRRYPDLRLLLAGEGPDEQRLRAKAAELGVGDKVVFLGPRLDMPELLALFDIYVLPSLSEGLPMALLEAMAAGCPIVASAVGGIPDCIENGVNGTLVSPANAEALAEALDELLGDANWRQKYSIEARRRFEIEFSAEAMARKYEMLYLGLDLEKEVIASRLAVP